MAVVDPIAELRGALNRPSFDERMWSEAGRDEREAILQRGRHHRAVMGARNGRVGVTPSGRRVALREWRDAGMDDAALEWSQLDRQARNAARRGIRAFMGWAERVAG